MGNCCGSANKNYYKNPNVKATIKEKITGEKTYKLDKSIFTNYSIVQIRNKYNKILDSFFVLQNESLGNNPIFFNYNKFDEIRSTSGFNYFNNKEIKYYLYEDFENLVHSAKSIGNNIYIFNLNNPFQINEETNNLLELFHENTKIKDLYASSFVQKNMKIENENILIGLFLFIPGLIGHDFIKQNTNEVDVERIFKELYNKKSKINVYS